VQRGPERSWLRHGRRERLDLAAGAKRRDLTQCRQFRRHSDWRLPNKNELQSIVESACHGPSINDARFPNTEQNAYWTGTTFLAVPAYAWDVSFVDGYSSGHNKATARYVRLVRGGQFFDGFDSLTSGCTSMSMGTACRMH
jgi:hypothetical protein